MVLQEEVWDLAICLTVQKPTSVGWLLFSTPLMDIDILEEAISTSIDGVPVGLQWKMILLGTQGLVPDDQKIKALHVYVDELNVPMAKPLLMQLYAHKTAEGHKFLLGIRMHLVPEIDTILNTKGKKTLKNCAPVKMHGICLNTT